MLTINVGPEMAKMLEQARRSMNALKGSVSRVSSSVKLESAGDDPGAIGSVALTESAISGIQRALRGLNEEVTVTQTLSEDLRLVEDLLLTLRELAEQSASAQFTDLQRRDLQTHAKGLLSKVDDAIKVAERRDGVNLSQVHSPSAVEGSEVTLNTQFVITDILIGDFGHRAVYKPQRGEAPISEPNDKTLKIDGVEIRSTASDQSDPSAINLSSVSAGTLIASSIPTEERNTASSSEVIGRRPVAEVELSGLNYFSLNGAVITGVTVADQDQNTEALRAAINAEANHTGVTAALTDQGQLKLHAQEGREIHLKYSNLEVSNALGIAEYRADFSSAGHASPRHVEMPEPREEQASALPLNALAYERLPSEGRDATDSSRSMPKSSLSALSQQAAINTINLSRNRPSLSESLSPDPSQGVAAAQRREKASRGRSIQGATADERSAAQDEKRARSARHLEEMMSAVEAAHQRSVAAVASLEALRQLGQAQLAARDVKAGQVSNAASLSASSTLSQLLERVDERAQSPSTRSEVRDAERAVNEARQHLQEMKSLTMEVQMASNTSNIAEQQVKLEAFITKMRNIKLPFIDKSGELSTSEHSSIESQATSSVALGRFSSEESQRGVDAGLPLRAGDLSVVTRRSGRVDIRGTVSADDPLSTRDAQGSALAKANAINAGSAQHGLDAMAGPTLMYSRGAIGAATLNRESRLAVNGVEVSGVQIQAGDTNGALRDALNAISDVTGVTATALRGGQLRLMAMDGRNIAIDASGEAKQLGLTPGGSGEVDQTTRGGSLTISSRDSFILEFGSNSGISGRALGDLQAVPRLHSLEHLDLTEEHGRIDAISVIDLALGDLKRLADALPREQ